MKNYLLATLPCLALLAGGATALSAKTANTGELPPATAFSPIERYAISYDKPIDLAEFYLRQFGLRTRDADFEQIDHPSDQAMRIMLVTVDDVEDDAVRGVQWRFGMRATAGRWEAVEAGIRRKCARGTETESWTRAVCP